MVGSLSESMLAVNDLFTLKAYAQPSLAVPNTERPASRAGSHASCLAPLKSSMPTERQ